MKVESARTLIYKPASYFERLKLAEMFPGEQPLEVELGSGDGSFLAAYAKAHPEHNFIGVERLLGRVRKLDRKAQRAGLTNLRVVRLEASYVVQWLLPPESTIAIHLYFPDPWPKRRHWKNRLVNEEFAKMVRQALLPKGRIYLRTDNKEYFEQMLRVFGGSADFRLVESPPELLAIKTDFERGFHAEGIPTLSAAYQRMN
jgi:tRNA (guanine-N7-)-methyltransferase